MCTGHWLGMDTHDTRSVGHDAPMQEVRPPPAYTPCIHPIRPGGDPQEARRTPDEPPDAREPSLRHAGMQLFTFEWNVWPRGTRVP